MIISVFFAINGSLLLTFPYTPHIQVDDILHSLSIRSRVKESSQILLCASGVQLRRATTLGDYMDLGEACYMYDRELSHRSVRHMPAIPEEWPRAHSNMSALHATRAIDQFASNLKCARATMNSQMCQIAAADAALFNLTGHTDYFADRLVTPREYRKMQTFISSVRHDVANRLRRSERVDMAHFRVRQLESYVERLDKSSRDLNPEQMMVSMFLAYQTTAALFDAQLQVDAASWSVLQMVGSVQTILARHQASVESD